LPLQADWHTELASPDQQLAARVELDLQGQLSYQVFRHDEAVIGPSPLGISLDNGAFETGLELESVSQVQQVSDAYRMWTGKQKEIRYQANQVELTVQNSAGQSMVLTLRVSNDGLAYRYGFPGKSEDTRVVLSERSGIQFFPDTLAWLQPKAEAQSGWMNTNPSYEEDYEQAIAVGTSAPTESGWVYPALFRRGDSWILISETGMDGNYCGSNLAQHSENGLYKIRFPQPAEVMTDGQLLPQARLPFHSPWRLVLVGDLTTIMNSTLGTDLADPSAVSDTGFIQPGIAAWSWGLLKDDATVYPVQEAFIDYASEMDWPYVLVDADWDRKIGYQKIAELVRYAAAKNVALLLWYNSSGAWNQTVYSPKSRLLTREDRQAEFARLQSIGIKGVKIDFFPGDGQSVFRYYREILEDAAKFELMVNFHGTTLPRGMQRTFPNLMTAEAVKGFEMITFFQPVADREATHSVMLAFTRNLFDPMDFTPMVLGDIPNIERRTSNAFQLALPVLFYSGIQHLVTTPEQMQVVPGYVKDYLRKLPGQWDESRFLQGYPGKFVVIARRSGAAWYVAGISGEDKPRQLKLDLSFIEKTDGMAIFDGDSPREFRQAGILPGKQEITLPPGGGFVMIF